MLNGTYGTSVKPKVLNFNASNSSPIYKNNAHVNVNAIKKAANLGHPKSCFILAKCYESGKYVDKNEEKALDTIRTQLAKLGDTPYIAREVRIETKPYFIPISVLNEWRRSTII